MSVMSPMISKCMGMHFTN